MALCLAGSIVYHRFLELLSTKESSLSTSQLAARRRCQNRSRPTRGLRTRSGIVESAPLIDNKHHHLHPHRPSLNRPGVAVISSPPPTPDGDFRRCSSDASSDAFPNGSWDGSSKRVPGGWVASRASRAADLVTETSDSRSGSPGSARHGFAQLWSNMTRVPPQSWRSKRFAMFRNLRSTPGKTQNLKVGHSLCTGGTSLRSGKIKWST